MTESCEEDLTHLITNVATTAGSLADMDMTQPIHEPLKEKHLLPATHLVDTGYLGSMPNGPVWKAPSRKGYAPLDYGLSM
jgi:hypothetical protein